MGSSVVPPRGPVTFDELLGMLTREGVLPPERAQEMFEQQERQLVKLVRLQRTAAGASARPEDVAESVGPIDLLMSFGAADAAGKPLSEDRVTEIYARRLGMMYVKLDPLK